MSRFSPSDVALEGFRLTREKPLAVLVWAALRIVYTIVYTVIFTMTGAAAVFAQISTLPPSRSPADVQRALALFGQVAPVMLLAIAIGLVFYAIAYAALLRAVLRPADKRFFYLRLSIEEGRQLGLALISFLIFFVYALAVEIVSMGLTSVVKGLGGAALPIEILIVLAVLAAFVYPAVRLSLAPAMTFADGRITLFRSLPVTRGLFWPMFGAYVLTVVLVIVVGLLGVTMFVLAAMALGAAQSGLGNMQAVLAAILQPQAVSLEAMATPLGVAKLVFGALLDTLGYVILFAPAAAIFRQLTGRVGAPTVHDPIPGSPWGQA